MCLDARIVRIILADLLETGNQYLVPLQYTVTVSGVYDLTDNVLAPAFKSALPSSTSFPLNRCICWVGWLMP